MGFRRSTTAIVAGLLTWVLGLGTVFSFNIWSDFEPLGMFRAFVGMNLYELTDHITSNIGLPLGGLLIATQQLNLTAGFYINDVLGALTLEDLFSGIGKSFFFAYFVAIVGCYNGLTARGGADGVGRATTNTVVLASILVLVSDFFLTKLFYILF